VVAGGEAEVVDRERGAGAGRGEAFGDAFELDDHRADLARAAGAALGELAERVDELRDAAARDVAAARQVEEAPREGAAIEVVRHDELLRDLENREGGEPTVLAEHECGLEVVVEGYDARPEHAEVRGRRLTLEVDQDALDDVALLDVAREAQRVV